MKIIRQGTVGHAHIEIRTRGNDFVVVARWNGPDPMPTTVQSLGPDREFADFAFDYVRAAMLIYQQGPGI